MKTIKTIILLLTFFTSTHCFATGEVLTILLNNTNTVANQTSAPVYAYPDARQAYYANYFSASNSQCSQQAPYACTIAPNNSATLAVSNLAHASSGTLFCLSSTAPGQGGFSDCGNNACMVKVNFDTRTFNKVSGDCSRYKFPQDAANEASTIGTIQVIN